MATSLDDTRPDALRVLTAIYSRMTAAEKLARVRELTDSANRLALAGLRMRHPGESEATALRRLAGLRLGEALAARVYGVTDSGA
jgi:hypothetical protein